MKSPKQADIESQKALVDVINNNKKIITLTNGKKVKIGYLTFDTQDKIDSLFVDYELKKKSIDKDDPLQLKKARKATRKFYAQTIAAAIINNYIGLRLFWGIKWRVIYHLWNINGTDFQNIVLEAKKKVAEAQYFLGMALLTSIIDTWTMLTTKEAEAFRQELELASKQHS